MKVTVIEECFLKALVAARKDGPEISAAIILTILLSFMTILGNSGMLIVFIKSKSLHSAANILLAVLCFFDLLVGAIVDPLLLTILVRDDGPHSTILVSFFLYMVSLFDGFSMVAITCIALERFTGVCFPFFYEKNASKKNSIFAISLSSVAWALLSFLFFINEVTLLYICTALEFLIFLTVSMCYMRIYKVIQKKRAHVIILGTIPDVDSATEITRRQERKKSKTIAILLVFFYVCFVPSFIYLIYLLVQEKCDDVFHSSIWLLLPTIANSAGNPLVYYISRRDIREEVKKTFRRTARAAVNPQN